MNAKKLKVEVYRNLGLIAVNGILYKVVDACKNLLLFSDMDDFQLIKICFHVQTSDSRNCLSILKFTATWEPMFGEARVNCAICINPTVNQVTITRRLISLQRTLKWKLGKPKRLCIGMALHARLGQRAPISALGADLCTIIAKQC